VFGCAIEAHKTLDSGLLESTYQQCPCPSAGKAKLLKQGLKYFVL